MKRTFLAKTNVACCHTSLGETNGVPAASDADVSDEAQSIGGRRSVGLTQSGIDHSERQRTVTYVHRSSPDIFKLASYFIEASPLIFSQFALRQPAAVMSRAELRRCHKPEIVYSSSDDGLLDEIVAASQHLRDHNNQRIGIIVFDPEMLGQLSTKLQEKMGAVHVVKERGELRAAVRCQGVADYVVGSLRWP